MTLSPQMWLARLATQMDNNGGRIQLLRDYISGQSPLPEGATDMRESYCQFQKKSRTNFGELIVSAVVERMQPSGFTFGKDSEHEPQLRQIWTRNQLQVGVSDCIRDMIGLSIGYLIVSQDPETKLAIVSYESPNQVVTEQSAARPDQVRAALKVYRDTVENIDVAYLHLVGEVHRFTRPLTDSLGYKAYPASVEGGWEYQSMELTGLDYIPVFPFVNINGLGEFETSLDLLDRINWNILQRLVITALQAYRQRWITGDLPTEDENGKELDYAAIFKPGAGALWQLPVGVEIGESQQTDLTAILLANRDDITHLSAVTRTPMSSLVPDGQNQSAEGAVFAREGLIYKVMDRISRATIALQNAMGAAIGIENGESSINHNVEVTWLPVQLQSLSEKADASSKASDLPWKTKMEMIWGFNDLQIEEMQVLRDEEAAKSIPEIPTVAENALVEPLMNGAM